ncbi:LmeA family phospholipid-binding protein [Corynebacterium freneyi]
MNAKIRKSKKRGNPVGTLIGVVLVIALVLIVGEIALRMFLGKEIADGFREQEEARGAVVTEDVQTSFGSSPVLLALVTSELGGMNLKTPSTLDITDPRAENGAPRIVGSPAADVTLTDVDISNTSDPVAKQVEVVAELPPELMIAEANLRVSDASGGSGNFFEDLVTSAVRLTDLTPHPDRGVLTAEFSGGLATVDLRPVVRDGGVTAEVEGGSFMGIDADGLISLFAEAAVAGPVQDIGHGFTVVDIAVTDGGLSITLEGADIALSGLSAIEYR